VKGIDEEEEGRIDEDEGEMKEGKQRPEDNMEEEGERRMQGREGSGAGRPA